MHKLSSHNIVSRVQDSDQYFLVNPLSGSADLLDAQAGARTLRGELPPEEGLAEWIAKGYVVDPDAEARRFRIAYLDFLDAREQDEVQVFFVPWYSCNFACQYCFQEGYGWSPAPLKPEVVEAFFAWVRAKLGPRRKYITLFGGEPLMGTPALREATLAFLARCQQEDLEVAIVTNGYHLFDYVDALSQVKVREVQVTLDGDQEHHDRRRVLHGGGPTFARIVQGIDACLAQDIPINLRMVVDRENLHSLPSLSQFAIERGWTRHPRFKTQLGRNYELHSCQEGQQKLYTRLEMFQELYSLVRSYPHILEFHKPAFSLSRFLFENGQLPAPLFDSCTGTKTEWALDGTGRIYACTATVGKQGEELGTFWPTLREDAEALHPWQERDVCSVRECTECSVRLACGGGCAAVAKNQKGSVLAPDCRPVQQLLELGIGLYSATQDSRSSHV